MKSLVLILLGLAVLAFVAIHLVHKKANLQSSNPMVAAFNQWKSTYGIQFANGEEDYKYEVFITKYLFFTIKHKKFTILSFYLLILYIFKFFTIKLGFRFQRRKNPRIELIKRSRLRLKSIHDLDHRRIC